MIYQRRDPRLPSKSSSLHQNFPISFFLFFLFDWWCTTGGVRNPMNSFFFRKNDLPVVKIPSRTAMLLYFMLQYKPLNKITFKLYTTFFLGKKKRKQLLKFSWGVQFKTWYTRILQTIFYFRQHLFSATLFHDLLKINWFATINFHKYRKPRPMLL